MPADILDRTSWATRQHARTPTVTSRHVRLSPVAAGPGISWTARSSAYHARCKLTQCATSSPDSRGAACVKPSARLPPGRRSPKPAGPLARCFSGIGAGALPSDGRWKQRSAAARVSDGPPNWDLSTKREAAAGTFRTSKDPHL